MARPQTKPPHPATVAQKKAAPAKKAKPPHPATVAQTKAAPAKKAKPPHPATVAQTKAAPAKKERPPHPATVAQKAAAPRKPAKPPHPAAAKKAAAKTAAGGGGSAPALPLQTGFFLIHDYGDYYLIVEPHQGKHCAGVWPGYNKKKGTILDGVSPGNLDLLRLLWDAATSNGSKPPAAKAADLDVATKGGTVRIQVAQDKVGSKTAYFIHAYPR